MNKYLKEFLHRGLMFSGFGPVILGIIFCVLSYTIQDFSLSGVEALTAIISTYMLAFIHAGASVFNQIEHWPLLKSITCHFSTLYLAYTTCYLLNSWIIFEPMVILIFTAVFVIVYILVWAIVLISLKLTSQKLNKKLL